MTKIYFNLNYKGEKIELISNDIDTLENHLFRVYGLSIDTKLTPQSATILTNFDGEKFKAYMDDVLCI